MLGGDANDFADIRQIVKLIEQRLELLGGRHPEQRPRRLVGFVEIAVRNAAGQTYQVAGLGLHPNAVQLQVQHAILDQDEFVLGRMNVNRDKLARVAVGLESKGRIRHRLWEINLSKRVETTAENQVRIEQMLDILAGELRPLFAQIANCETTDQVSSCFSSQNGADLGRVYTNDPGLNVCLVPSPAPTPEAEQ